MSSVHEAGTDVNFKSPHVRKKLPITILLLSDIIIRMAKHIMLVDDDALMRRSLAFNLEQAGFHASAAANAEDALSMAKQNSPDLVLLDISLPGMDGLDAIKRFKEQFRVPVIFVTARRRNLDEVLGLELGADDYITKPFDVDVLIAHIKAVLRRNKSASDSPQTAPPIKIDDLTLDPTAHTVTLAGKNRGTFSQGIQPVARVDT